MPERSRSRKIIVAKPLLDNDNGLKNLIIVLTTFVTYEKMIKNFVRGGRGQWSSRKSRLRLAFKY
jgi:hypothetical protein